MSDCVIITSSRLVTKNAVDNIIKTIPLLDSTYKLLIAGDGAERKSLEKLSRDLKVSDRVKFMGFVSHKDLPSSIQSSDVFVRTSRSEGLGNSFLEAMACRIPVIATRVGGIPDFLIDGETGLFCNVDDPKDLSQKICSIFRDQDFKNNMISKAQDMVADMYTWDSISYKIGVILSLLKIKS
jgi:glycosyltransferase involved in cell wall biosynthesis